MTTRTRLSLCVTVAAGVGACTSSTSNSQGQPHKDPVAMTKTPDASLGPVDQGGQPRFDPNWPGDPKAAWPTGCIIWDVGRHPKLPWVTLACNKDDFGAIMVIDARSGSMISATTSDEAAGWANDGLVRWDESGTRLAINADTSAIAVLEEAKYAGLDFPDGGNGRDGATRYVWVDHRIYTDTGHFFDPKHDEGGARFEFPDPPRELHWTIEGMEWNANIGAVVGPVDPPEGPAPQTRSLIAYAPASDTVVYERPLGDVMGLRWSADGRWLLMSERAPRGGPAHVIVIDGNDGRETRRFLPKHERAGRTSISNRGDVVVASPARPVPTVELWRATGAPAVALGDHAVISIDWSADAQGVALLDRAGTIAVYDVATAKAVATIDVAAPQPPKGLPDWATPKEPFGGHTDLLWLAVDRFAVVGPYYVSIYAIDGFRVAQFIAPF